MLQSMSSSHNSKFLTKNGQLEHDSPALIGYLNRYRVGSKRIREVADALYGCLFNLGLIEHHWLKREPSVNFNPLPARLTQIALDSTNGNAWSSGQLELLVEIGFTICLPPFEDEGAQANQPSVISSNQILQAKLVSGPALRSTAILREHLAESRSGDETTAPSIAGLSQCEGCILLSYNLDVIRHLHLPGAELDDKARRANKIRHQCLRLKEESPSLSQSCHRLLNLTEGALTKFSATLE